MLYTHIKEIWLWTLLLFSTESISKSNEVLCIAYHFCFLISLLHVLYYLWKPVCSFCPSGWDCEQKSTFWNCSALWPIGTKSIHQIIPDFKVTISISSVVIIFLLYFILRWENIYIVWIFLKNAGTYLIKLS